jgi:hypothetical protein
MKKTRVGRLRITTPDTAPVDATEGTAAAWWREHILGLSRPGLAQLLDISSKTIEREESRDRVSTQYRLACAAINASLDEWAWKRADAERWLRVQSKAKKMERLRRAKQHSRSIALPRKIAKRTSERS